MSPSTLKRLNRALTRATLMTTISLSFLAACVASPPDENQPSPREQSTSLPPTLETLGATISSEMTPEATEADKLKLKATLTLPRGLEKYETIPPGGVVGEVPEIILDEIISDLSQNLGVDNQEIQIIKADSVVWNDGSLGCAQPGMMYTQALVNGYQVVLAVGDQEYDYRASDTGYFFLCEGVLPLGGYP
jgi:hypothetical protein